MYYNLFDSHTHTDNSPDAHHSAMMLCESAVEKGLSGISITDHCDMQDFETDNFAMRIRQSYFETLKAKSVFGSTIAVCSGIELGQPLEAPDKVGALLDGYDFDFVLCSLHALKGLPDFYFGYYAGHSAKQLDIIFDEYLRQLLKTIRWGRFDSLAHLTYPLRYMINRDGETVELSHHAGMIDEALSLLIHTGKALEINTSGLRGTLGKTMPPVSVIRRYRELGGELITFGSDAHYRSDVGAGLSDTMQLAADAGFRYFAFYRERRPQMFKLI